MRYPIAIEAGDETTSWGVVVPDLPGCYSAGDSFIDACENAKEAIALWTDSAKEDGIPIPTPKPLSEHQANPEFTGWAWAMVDVDLT